VAVAHHQDHHKAVHLQAHPAAEQFSQCLILRCKAGHLQVHHKAGHLQAHHKVHLQAVSPNDHQWTQP
jgi:hypothetical protein